MDGTWIYELGSNHLGRIDIISKTLEYIRQYRSFRYDIVLKLQLFPNLPQYTDAGNYHVSRELWIDAVKEARNFGIPITASVFDLECLDLLLDVHPGAPFVKIAYSQKENHVLVKEAASRKHTLVSCDHMSKHRVYSGNNIWHLYCIPMYPVPFPCCFDDHIFKLFKGFSDHTLGIESTKKAVSHGAKIIEKHVLPPDHTRYNITCPDSTFSITARDFMRCVAKCQPSL